MLAKFFEQNHSFCRVTTGVTQSRHVQPIPRLQPFHWRRRWGTGGRLPGFRVAVLGFLRQKIVQKCCDVLWLIFVLAHFVFEIFRSFIAFKDILRPTCFQHHGFCLNASTTSSNLNFVLETWVSRLAAVDPKLQDKHSIPLLVCLCLDATENAGKRSKNRMLYTKNTSLSQQQDCWLRVFERYFFKEHSHFFTSSQ